MAADPYSATAGLIEGALRLTTAGLEIYLDRRVVAREQEQAARQDQAESRRRAEDQQQAREEYIRGRRDKREDDDRAAALARETEALRHYPFTAGAGSLRENIRTVYADLQTMPPLILIVPTRDGADPMWHSLSRRVEAFLMPLQHAHLAFVQAADRDFTWPHAALLRHDLAGVPTVVLRVEVVSGWLLVWLGGSHLGGQTVRPMSQIAWMPLPDRDAWTRERLDALEEASSHGFVSPPSVADERSLSTVQTEWATRLAAVAATAAVDAYHLLRRRGYDEQIDTAIRELGPEAAAQLVFPVDREALADPAYHLLHRSRRQIALGDRAAARADVVEALEALNGRPSATLRDAILAARADKQLAEWHVTMLERLDRESPDLLDAKARAALREPLPVAAPAAPSRELVRRTRDKAGESSEPRIVLTRGGDPNAPFGEW